MGEEMETEKNDVMKESRGRAFVRYVIEHCEKDKGNAAAFRRADNPALQHRCWPLLVRFRVNLESVSERAAFSCIGSAVVQAKVKQNGSVALPRALFLAYGSAGGPAAMRMRRLLACTTTVECCSILRTLFKLVSSKTDVNIDYGRLLDELLSFPFRMDEIKARWAQEFYRLDQDMEKTA